MESSEYVSEDFRDAMSLREPNVKIVKRQNDRAVYGD